MGYVSSLEGIFYLPTQSKHFLKWGWKNRIWGWDHFHLTPKFNSSPLKIDRNPKRQPDRLQKPSFFRGDRVGGNQRVFGVKFQELETYLSKRRPFNPKGVLWKAVYTICMYIYMKFHLLSSIFTSKIMHCGERIDGDRHSLKVANRFWGVYHKPWEWRSPSILFRWYRLYTPED